MRSSTPVWSALGLAALAGLSATAVAAPPSASDRPVQSPTVTESGGILPSRPSGMQRGVTCDPRNDGINCHTADLTLGANFSNLGANNYRTMDNFTPTNSNPTQLCWIGRYQNRINPIANESFLVRIFADVGGLPDLDSGPIFERTFVANGTPGVDLLEMSCLSGDTCPGTTDPVAGGHWVFSAEVAAGFPVTGGGCYWLEIANSGTSNPGCSTDWDGNGSVNSSDISAFLTAWLASLNNGDLDADFDGSGQVNSTDISAFLTAWLDQLGGDCGGEGALWGWVGSQTGTDLFSLQAIDGAYTTFTRAANDRSFCFNGGVNPLQGNCVLPPMPEICTNDSANGIPPNGGLTNGFRASAPGSTPGSCFTPFQRAENFQFDQPQTVTNVCFGGFWVNTDATCATVGFTPPEIPEFHILYYEDVDGFPAPTPMASFVTGQPGVSFVWDGDEVVSVTHPPVNFEANTCYYISIGTIQSQAAPGQTTTGWVWFLTFSSTPTGDNWIYTTDATDPNGWVRFDISSPSQGGNMWFLFNAGPTTLPVCEPPPCDPSEIPVNDDCANAITLAVPSVVTGTTLCATLDGEPDCTGSASTAPGVWYRVLGTGGMMTASACLNVNYDGQMAVFTGGCGGLTCVGGGDDTCGVGGGHATVSWPSTAGVEYLIFVYGWGGATGNFTLEVSSN